MNTFDRKIVAMQGCNITRLRIIYVLILTGYLFALSCDDTICPTELPTGVIIVFKDLISKEKKGIGLDSIKATGSDSTYFAGDSLTTFSLPVNHFRDSTVYFFFRDEGTDTLVVRYDLQYNLVNRECGFYADAANFQAGFTTFPKAVSNNEILKAPDEPDIEIYY